MYHRRVAGIFALALSSVVLLVACSGSTGSGSGPSASNTSSPTAPSAPTKPPITLGVHLCQAVSQSEASQAANGPVSRVLDVQDQDEELGLDRVTCTYADFSNVQRPVARVITLFVIANENSVGVFAKAKQGALESAISGLQDIGGLGDTAFGGRITGSNNQLYTVVEVLRGNLILGVYLSRDQAGALDRARGLAQLILDRV